LYNTDEISLQPKYLNLIVGPQWGSAALDLQPYNSSCVQLSWDSPEFPGEEIIGYEVNNVPVI